MITSSQFQAALLDEMIDPHAGAFTGLDLARMVGQFNGAPLTIWRGPTRTGRAMVGPHASKAANRLMRHYRPLTEGVNVYILTDNTVTEAYPADSTMVRRVLYGAHDETVTPVEAALLISAGYSAYLNGDDG